jgi:hypothetical protein
MTTSKRTFPTTSADFAYRRGYGLAIRNRLITSNIAELERIVDEGYRNEPTVYAGWFLLGWDEGYAAAEDKLATA